MNEFAEKLRNAFKPGSPAAKYSFGLLFFSIALLIVIIGLEDTVRWGHDYGRRFHRFR